MTLGATDTIEQLAVNTIRTLSMDAVQAANSGHPGTPMALAPVAYRLWQDYLRFDPELPVWANRDRFVLSVGDASARASSPACRARRPAAPAPSACRDAPSSPSARRPWTASGSC